MKKNTKEYKPDIRRAMNAADELLIATAAINAFPYSVTTLINTTTDIQIRSFQYLRHRGIEPYAFGSKDALIFEYNGMVIMAYSKDVFVSRVRFSILHELGHFILDHEMSKDITKELYNKQEVEANYFAAQLLMPEQILGELRKRCIRLSIGNIKKYFGVSSNAADLRLGNLEQGLEIRSRWPGDYDDIILAKYQSFIENVAPLNVDNYSFDNEYEIQQDRDSWFY